jgi:hypothetical protein
VVAMGHEGGKPGGLLCSLARALSQTARLS